MEKNWLKHYPAGVPAEIDADVYPSLVEPDGSGVQAVPGARRLQDAGALDQLRADRRGLARVRRVPAGPGPGEGRSRRDHDAQRAAVPRSPSRRCCAPVSSWSTSTRCTRRASLEHQPKDAGAKAIVIIENFAATLQQVLANVPTKHIVLAAMGDMLGFAKGMVVNYVVRKVKKLVPAFELPSAVRFNDAVSKGRGQTYKRPTVGPNDIAVLQYTGGTTGVLQHRDVVGADRRGPARRDRGPSRPRSAHGEGARTPAARPCAR